MDKEHIEMLAVCAVAYALTKSDVNVVDVTGIICSNIDFFDDKTRFYITAEIEYALHKGKIVNQGHQKLWQHVVDEFKKKGER